MFAYYNLLYDIRLHKFMGRTVFYLCIVYVRCVFLCFVRTRRTDGRSPILYNWMRAGAAAIAGSQETSQRRKKKPLEFRACHQTALSSSFRPCPAPAFLHPAGRRPSARCRIQLHFDEFFFRLRAISFLRQQAAQPNRVTVTVDRTL